MAENLGKENIADGLVATSSAKAPAVAPQKKTRRTRSQSIGPGGLGALDEPVLKESSGNRRKSAFIPAVKSILASNDADEKKRREERRKSLARRRVSFAPEATLHTWDVVEYLRDATTSSASSEATRRASNISQDTTHVSPAPDSDAEEPPSTPPEQAEEQPSLPGSSPANQRDLHQKKNRRRSSGIPPMNFNNPEDIYSSSPLSGDNYSPGGMDSDADEGNDATHQIDNSPDVNDSSQSSAKLDAALRQAAAHASTQKLDLDGDGDLSMELAEEEITAAIKPWAKKAAGTPKLSRRTSSFQNEEHVDPFSPAVAKPLDSGDDEDAEDMSMDITRAIGRIVPRVQSQSPDPDDATMDLTMPLGSIKQVASQEPKNRRKSLKRGSSVLEASRGSPAKRPASRRTSLRNRPLPVENDEDASPDDVTMEFTTAIGSIKNNHKAQETARRNSVESSFGDETMDFTVAVGSIKDVRPAPGLETQGSDQEEDEDLSMEFTNVIGGIKTFNRPAATPEKPVAVVERSPLKPKTPTPRKSPKKSPYPPGSSGSKDPQSSSTPRKSPGRPRKNVAPSTPEIIAPQQVVEDFEPSPFVHSAPQSPSKPSNTVSTPTSNSKRSTPEEIPQDPIAAPILKRRRSSLSAVQFSPLAAPREEPTLKSTAVLTNSIRLLSTPRKQTLASPMKRGLTPKKSQSPQKASTPNQKTPTPKKATPRQGLSPRKRVAFGEEPPVAEDVIEDEERKQQEEVERISLQEFLDLTKIRFMELSTTKRRHTAAPAAFHDKEDEEQEESLDRFVVAAACTLPEFDLYQHACHEMKRSISEGRNVVGIIEENVMDENPLLFSEYLTAPPDQRIVMDNQFKNLKTNARLEARGIWYGWRSTLLQDLKAGLLSTMEGFNRDESVLAGQEKLLDSVLPPLIERNERLKNEHKMLQQRHDELNSCDKEELEQAREQLMVVDAELEQKRRLIAELQHDLAEKEIRIEAVKERKIECVEEIKAAEHVREEYRGWSTSEVNELKAKVNTLEQAYGWSITSASPNGLTMTHLNDLELFFQPFAFAIGSNTPNAPISLTYVGDTATPHSRPLTTSKRFFLQLIRAHLHCLPQSQTRITELLALVKNGWACALAVAEGIRWLEHNQITDVSILSDERMAISANMLLPTLQTKVRVIFEVGVSLTPEGVNTEVNPRAEIVYGEKYSEDKMGAFLRDFCGNAVKAKDDMGIWADAVLDLAGRLRATGRKGERA